MTSNNMQFGRFIQVLGFFIFFSWASQAVAIDKFWVGPNGGAFNNGSNWASTSGGGGGAGAPGVSDRAVFDSGSNNCDINASISIGGISITSGYSGIITQLTGNTFTVGNQNYSQAGGTFTGGNSTIDINGALTISGGTFTSTTGTLFVSGNWTHTAGGTFTHNSGTVEFDGTSATAMDVTTSETFNNVTINKTSTNPSFDDVNLATVDKMIILGNLFLTDGQVNSGTVDTADALDVRGNVTVGANYSGGTSAMTFSGSTATQNFTLTGAEGKFDNDITINKSSGTVLLGSDLTLDTAGFDLKLQSGTLDTNSRTVRVDGTYNQSGGTTSFGSSSLDFNNFVLSAGTFTSTTGSLYVSGNWTHTAGGTFTHNSGTVEFDGTSATAMNVNTSETFNNVTINKTSGNGSFDDLNLATTDKIVVTGNLILTDGQVNSATANTADAIEAQGNVTVGASFSGGNSAMTFSGSAVTQDFTLTGAEGNFNNDITINKSSGTVRLLSNLTLDTSSFDINLQSGTFNANTYAVRVDGVFNQTGGTFNGSSSMTVGSINISSGSFDDASGTITIENNFTHSGGTATFDSGTVLFNGTGPSIIDVTVSGLSFNNFTLNLVNSNDDLEIGTSLTPDTISVNGTLTLTNGDFTYGTLNFLGDMTVASTFDGAETAGTSTTLIANGSGAQNLTINGGAALPILTLNNSNATMSTTGSGTITFEGAYTHQAGTANSSSVALTYSGNFSITGGTYGGGELGTTLTYNSGMTINGGTYNANAANLSIGSMTVSAGTFNANTSTITVENNFTHSGGTTNFGTSSLVFNGTGNSTIETTTDGMTVYNMTVNLTNGSDDLLFGSSGTPDTVTANGTLTLLNGDFVYGTLNAKGDITINGFDGLESTTTSTLLNVNGTSTQTITITAGSSLPDFVLNNSQATITTSGTGTITFKGTYTHQAGTLNGFDTGLTGKWDQPFSMSGGTLTGNAGAFDFNDTFTLSGGTFTAVSGNMSFATTYTHTAGGTFNHNNGTVVWDGSSSNIDVATSETFFNGTIATSIITKTIAAGDTLVFLGNLSLTDGKFNGGTVEARGNVTVASTYDLSSTSKLLFSGSAIQNFDLTGATAVFDADVEINKSANEVVLLSDFTANANNQDLIILEGTLNINGSNLTVNGTSGTFVVQDGGTLKLQGGETASAPTLQSGSTVNYVGTSGPYTLKNYSYHHLIINGGPSSVFSFGATGSVGGNLTLTSGILSTSGNDLTVTGSFSNNTTFRVYGNETLTMTMDTDSGLVEYIGDGDGSGETFTLKETGATDFYNLTINDVNATKDTFNAGSNLNVANTLTVSSGTMTHGTSTVTAASYSQGGGTFTGGSASVDINGGFDLSAGVFTSTSGTLYVSGTFTHSGGTFTHNSGTVSLDGNGQTLVGATTFNNLTKTVLSNATLTLPASTTTTVVGTLTWQGTGSATLSIRSSSNGVRAVLDSQGSRTVEYLDIKDINNTSTLVLGCYTGCNDSTNNLRIAFSQPTVTLGVSGSPFAENGGSASATATLSAESDQDVTVNFAFSGTATNISDYTRSGVSVVITAGSTTGSITLTGVDDNSDETNETVIVDISSVSNGSESGTQQITATITDDDVTPSVAWTASSQSSVGESGTLTLTAQLSVASGLDVTVPFTMSGTATGSGTDYSITSTPVTITAGSTTTTVTITIASDTLDENDETVIATIGTPTNATQGGTLVHTATITDDDATPTVDLSRSAATMAETGGSATVTATLSAASGRDVTVNLSYTGTATGSGTDYTASASSITILAGATTGTVTLTSASDTLDEEDETVISTLGSLTNVTSGSVTSVTVTITDDDSAPTVDLSRSAATMAETGGSATVTATLSAASAKDITVNLSYSGTATGSGTDYTASASSITILAGATTGTVTLTSASDTLDEEDETVISTLGSLTNVTSGSVTSVTVTITDDDAAPTVDLSRSAATMTETGGSATVTATLSAASAKDITVNLTYTGTATGSGTDYTASASSITILAGATTGTVTLTSASDTLDEANETIISSLGSLTNVTAGSTTSVTVTITDDDSAPTISFTTSSQSSVGESGTLTMTAELSAPSGLNVSLPYVVTGTATGGGLDYTIPSSPITIAIGSTTATINIYIDSDTIDEDNETVIVTLGTPTNATLGSTTVHTATITDDDAAPTLSIADQSITESETSQTMTFTVSLSAASGKTVSIDYATADGTALAGLDYTLASGSLSFSPGETSKTLDVTILGDTLDENNETFTSTLTNPGNASILTASATGTIIDNEGTPTVSFQASQSKSENSGTVTVTLTLSNVSGLDVSVPFSVSGTATNGSDYSISSSPSTISAGLTTQTISVSITDDSSDEADETVVLTMGTPTNAGQGLTTSHTLTITDNDSTGVTITQTGGSTAVTEGGIGADTYTVVLTSQPSADVVVSVSPDSQVSTGATSSLTFTSANWDTVQTVTVSAVDDNTAEGNHTGSITHSVTSDDTSYNGSSVATVTVNITDNDTASVSITQSGGSTAVTEAGATDTYTVVLTSQPSSGVTVSISVNSQVSVDTSSLSFTTGNWNSPQTVTVTAVNDSVAEGNHTGSITHASSSSDTNYNALAITSITASITDNDTAAVSIIQTGGSTVVTEAGTTDTYSLILTSQPTANVTVTLNPGAQLTSNVSSLTFTSNNWNVAQVATLTAVNDSVAEGNHSATVTHSSTSSDTRYNGLTISNLTVSITDNDTAGVSIAQSSGSTVLSPSTIDTYTVVLTSQPTADVMVAMNETSLVTSSPGFVTFTTGNWNTPQTFTLSMLTDNPDQVASDTITHTVTSLDTFYNALLVSSFTVTLESDEEGTTGGADTAGDTGTDSSGETTGGDTGGEATGGETTGGEEEPTISANAGGNQTLITGNSLALDGTQSTGTNLTYSWVIIDGDGTLSDSDTATPTFTSSSDDENGTTTVRLTVTDENSVSDFDEITITLINETEVNQRDETQVIIGKSDSSTLVYEQDAGDGRLEVVTGDTTIVLPEEASTESGDVAYSGYNMIVTNTHYVVISVPSAENTKGQIFFSQAPVESLASVIDLDFDLASSYSLAPDLLGNPDLSLETMNTDTTTTDSMIAITGSLAGDNLGAYLSSGDIDNDGETEILIAAPGAGRYGIVYVYTQSAELIGVIFGSEENSIQSIMTGSYIAANLEDILFGPDNQALNDDLHYEEALTESDLTDSTFFLAGSEVFEDSIDLAETTLDASVDTTSSFQSMAFGDINGDDNEDLILAGSNGTLYIFFGTITQGTYVNTSNADVTITGGNSEDAFGQMMITSDVTGDGLNDLIIGAPLYGSTNTGAVYVIFGRETWTDTLDITDNPTTLKVVGDTENAQIGSDLLAADTDNNGTFSIYSVTSQGLNTQINLTTSENSGETTGGSGGNGISVEGASGCSLNITSDSSNLFLTVISLILSLQIGVGMRKRE